MTEGGSDPVGSKKFRSKTTGSAGRIDSPGNLRDLKNNLCSDYEVRRDRAAPPPIQDKLLAISEETISDDTLTAKQS